jgi:predicted ATP-grasp superfamily ATP-dependent carboligase
MTIAMQGAIPIMIKPVMYSGYSFKNNVASKNIKKGPTIQVIRKEAVSNFGFSSIKGIFEKSILVNGGYIININPIASGIFVVPLEKELIKPLLEGIKYPMETPIAIAKNIQSVK